MCYTPGLRQSCAVDQRSSNRHGGPSRRLFDCFRGPSAIPFSHPHTQSAFIDTLYIYFLLSHLSHATYSSFCTTTTTTSAPLLLSHLTHPSHQTVTKLTPSPCQHVLPPELAQRTVATAQPRFKLCEYKLHGIRDSHASLVKHKLRSPSHYNIPICITCCIRRQPRHSIICLVIRREPTALWRVPCLLIPSALNCNPLRGPNPIAPSTAADGTDDATNRGRPSHALPPETPGPYRQKHSPEIPHGEHVCYQTGTHLQRRNQRH